MLWVSVHILPWFGCFLFVLCLGRVESLLLLPLAPLAMIWGFKLSARTARIYAPGVWEDAWVRRWEMAAAVGIFLAPVLTTTAWLAVAWLLIRSGGYMLPSSSGDVTQTLRVVDAVFHVLDVDLALLGIAILVLICVLVMQIRAVNRAQRRARQGN